tara:strand:- start:3863 stop:4111 length:249 start_codon:yes stop_codon:yes gene_type:complete
MIATPISNVTINKITINGIMLNTLDNCNNNIKLKFDIIPNNICPAVKFAANLNPNAIGLEKALIISIKTKKEDINKGAPLGI